MFQTPPRLRLAGPRRPDFGSQMKTIRILILEDDLETLAVIIERAF